MNAPFRVGERVVVTCFGEPRWGQTGVVTLGDYPALISGRTMADVLFDGEPVGFDEGVYVQNLERVARLEVVA